MGFENEGRQLNLPSILVVDDEIGAEPLFRSVPQLTRWADLAKQRRHEYCQSLGLVSEGEPELHVKHPVAKATFLSSLRWNGSLSAVPDPDLLVHELQRKQESGAPPYALVLLDLQFGYGTFDPNDGDFSLRSTTYGLDVLLPVLKKQFGMNSASPRTGWLAIPVIVVSAFPKEELEPRIRARGAREMLEKRAAPEKLREALQIHLIDHGLMPDQRGIIAGHSLSLLNCLAAARRAAQASLKVLLLGETGTGKELIAAYIHDHSPRRLAPYCVFHAPGRAEGLQEDELFGHTKGAFTGALDSRPGLLEVAQGGTLFVDEIADVGQGVQRSLMRPVEQGTAKRVGALKEFTVDVKFVFATNKDIQLLARSGLFLPDLLSRIQQFTIYLPPLRNRKDDIPALAQCLLARVDLQLSSKLRHFLDEGALNRLAALTFEDGNVRELENLLRSAAISHRSDARITDADLGTDDSSSTLDVEMRGTTAIQSPGEHDRISLFTGLVTGRKRWNQLTLEEGRIAAQSLQGVAPELLVRLLELSLQSILLAGGSFSMVRLMEHVWGVEGITSQQARRYLDRMLKTAPGAAVAKAASASTILMAEPRLARSIRTVSIEESANE